MRLVIGDYNYTDMDVQYSLSDETHSLGQVIITSSMAINYIHYLIYEYL